MAEIINIEEYKKKIAVKKKVDLTVEDIFNLFLVFRQSEEKLPIVDLNMLMKSIAKYKNMERFTALYKSLEIEKNEDGIDIINLESCINQKAESRTILINPSKKTEIIILSSDEESDKLRKKYNEHTLSLFRDLMFFIDKDLEYGIDNWSLVAEDEYIDIPGYPGIVTGEFLGQEKNSTIMKKVRKKAIERLKNKENI